jgi:hypothetical protein
MLDRDPIGDEGTDVTAVRGEPVVAERFSPA